MDKIKEEKFRCELVNIKAPSLSTIYIFHPNLGALKEMTLYMSLR
jgi:hypothetical protein